MVRRFMAPRTPWQPGFPPVIGQTSYKFMRDHPCYRAAKDGLDDTAALNLVYDSMDGRKIDLIRTLLDGKRPYVVAVHAEEATGRNKIPMAYAEVLADTLGLETEPRIVQSSVANHGGAPTIFHRFVSQPTFFGIVEPGGTYLIVDDTCTAGGTLTNLKGYLERNKGIVVAMSVLALTRPESPYEISLDETTLARLRYRHPRLDALWREEFGYGVDTLTEGEAGHLLATPSLVAIRSRLSDARRDLNISYDETDDREPPEAETELDERNDEMPSPS